MSQQVVPYQKNVPFIGNSVSGSFPEAGMYDKKHSSKSSSEIPSIDQWTSALVWDIRLNRKSDGGGMVVAEMDEYSVYTKSSKILTEDAYKLCL